MARIKNGMLGGFSGKLGTGVGYQLPGGDFVRSLPIRRVKATENELVNRAKFKLVQDCLHPLKSFLKVFVAADRARQSDSQYLGKIPIPA